MAKKTNPKKIETSEKEETSSVILVLPEKTNSEESDKEEEEQAETLESIIKGAETDDDDDDDDDDEYEGETYTNNEEIKSDTGTKVEEPEEPEVIIDDDDEMTSEQMAEVIEGMIAQTYPFIVDGIMRFGTNIAGFEPVGLGAKEANALQKLAKTYLATQRGTIKVDPHTAFIGGTLSIGLGCILKNGLISKKTATEEQEQAIVEAKAKKKGRPKKEN